MKPEKRRRRRAEKNHENRVKKQELQDRIRELRREFLLRLEILPALWFIAERLLLQQPSRKSDSKHKKLTLEERQVIYLYRSRGMGVREIAKSLKRAPSTISRELKRNRPPQRLHGMDSWSRAKQAHDTALARRKRARLKRVRLKSWVIQGLVEQKIRDGLTPELVSGRLYLEHGIRISHEAIYRWIYDIKRELIEFLWRKGKRYQRGGKKRTRALPKVAAPKLSIEMRPAVANERREFGHWEVDCILSRQSKTCLLVIQERVSRFFFVVKLPFCRVEEAQREIVRILSSLPKHWVKSLTCDNGAENWGHELISKQLDIPVYFCHPYCSSERGGIENRNGVLRKFFPKKTNFTLVSEQELNQVREQLIHRPMRCLGYFTPYEIFHETFTPLLKLAA